MLNLDEYYIKGIYIKERDPSVHRAGLGVFDLLTSPETELAP